MTNYPMDEMAAQAQQGNGAAFAALVKTYRPRFLREAQALPRYQSVSVAAIEIHPGVVRAAEGD